MRPQYAQRPNSEDEEEDRSLAGTTPPLCLGNVYRARHVSLWNRHTCFFCQSAGKVVMRVDMGPTGAKSDVQLRLRGSWMPCPACAPRLSTLDSRHQQQRFDLGIGFQWAAARRTAPAHEVRRSVRWFITSSGMRFGITKPAACTIATGIGQGSLATILLAPVIVTLRVFEPAPQVRRQHKAHGPQASESTPEAQERLSALPGCQRNSWVLH